MGGTETGLLASPKERNRLRVVDVLRRRGAVSRAEIAEQTGLARSTVSAIVGALQREGLLAERASDGRRSRTSEGGRPPVLLALERSAGTLAGIDIRHDRVRVAIADLAYEVIGEHVLADDVGGDPAVSFSTAAVAVDQLLDDAGIPPTHLLGAGVASPEPIDRDTGAVRGDAFNQRWAGIDIAAELREQLPADTALQVDSDAGAAALAEATVGAAQDHEFVAYVRLSQTVGMGLVLDGRPFRGAAGEFGHVLIDPHGPICRCGNRGCLETFVSGKALSEQLSHSHGPLGVAEILELAAAGDRGCQRVIYDAGRVVGLALADLCNTAGPDVVVIGGELVAAGDLLMDPLRAAIRQHVIRTGATEVTVVASPLGDRAELLGALVLAGHGSADVAAGVTGGASKRRRGQ